MRLRFLGGAGMVTGSKYLLEHDRCHHRAVPAPGCFAVRGEGQSLRVEIAEVLVLLAVAAVLFVALTPFRRWIEKLYIRKRGGTRGVVVAMRRREDGSYAAFEDAARSDARAEGDDAGKR